MIAYKRGRLGFVKILQFEGSVFPFSFWVAFPCSALTAILRICIEKGWVPGLGDPDDSKTVLKDNTCWSGFVFLVGFLVVFRTSQAYARFWDGCTSTHQMRAEWFDACSALVAFCKFSKASDGIVMEFQHTLIRLFSMLHAVALAEIEDTSSEGGEVAAFKYELIDAAGLESESLKAVKDSDAKVELVFQWIQQLIVEHIETGVLHIPPPILSRAFQEIANGMVAFHEAIKISTIPFPFPYAQTCECLLLMHWFCTPLVVAQWVSTPWWGALFSFITVFIYWSLNSIATEIENPFGSDANDIDAEGMQVELNRHLLLLLEPQVRMVPRLTQDLINAVHSRDNSIALSMTFRRTSLEETWTKMEGAANLSEHPPTRTIRCSRLVDCTASNSLGGKATVTRRSTNALAQKHRTSKDVEVNGIHSICSDNFAIKDPQKDELTSSWGRNMPDPVASWLTLRTVNEEEDAEPTNRATVDGNGNSGSNQSWSDDETARQLRQNNHGTALRRGDFSHGEEGDPAGARDGGQHGEANSDHGTTRRLHASGVRPGSPSSGATRRLHASGVQSTKQTTLSIPKYNPPRG